MWLALSGGELIGIPGFMLPDAQTALQTSVVVSVATASFFVGYWSWSLFLLSPHRSEQGYSRQMSGYKLLPSLSLSLLLVGLVGVVILSVAQSGSSSILGYLLSSRSAGGVFGSLSALKIDSPVGTMFFSALVPSAALSIYLALLPGTYPRFPLRTIMAITGLTALMPIIAAGGRTGMVTVFGSALLLLVLERWMRAPRPSRPKRIYLLTVSVVFVVTILLISTLQLNFRTVGWLSADRATVSSLEIPDAFTGSALNRELTLVVQLDLNALAVDSRLESIALPIPDTILSFVYAFIPRSLWAGKPVDETWVFYNELRTGSSGLFGSTNLTPTYIGRYYMRYGIIGVVQIGLLLGLAWRVTERGLFASLGRQPATAMLFALFALFLFQSTRDIQAGRIYPVAVLACAIVSVRLFLPMSLKRSV